MLFSVFDIDKSVRFCILSGGAIFLGRCTRRRKNKERHEKKSKIGAHGVGRCVMQIRRGYYYSGRKLYSHWWLDGASRTVIISNRVQQGLPVSACS